MPFNQSGSNASATFGTYNDVAGSQTNNSKSSTVGNVTAGNGGNAGTGVGVGAGIIAGGHGSGGSGGSGGTVNISS